MPTRGVDPCPPQPPRQAGSGLDGAPEGQTVRSSSFLILSAGGLAVRTDGGLMALLLSKGAAGVMARRLLPAALVVDGDAPPHVDHVLNKLPKLRELREILARL
jgi:hypothetical protein